MVYVLPIVRRNEKLLGMRMAKSSEILSDPRDRRLATGAVVCAPLSMVLGVMVHPCFAVVAIVPAAFLSYEVCGGVSWYLFGKDFVFVSKFGLNTPEEERTIRWTDYVLTFLCAIVAILGMFLAGEMVDQIRGENVWKWDRRNAEKAGSVLDLAPCEALSPLRA